MSFSTPNSNNSDENHHKHFLQSQPQTSSDSNYDNLISTVNQNSSLLLENEQQRNQNHRSFSSISNAYRNLTFPDNEDSTSSQSSEEEDGDYEVSEVRQSPKELSEVEDKLAEHKGTQVNFDEPEPNNENDHKNSSENNDSNGHGTRVDDHIRTTFATNTEDMDMRVHEYDIPQLPYKVNYSSLSDSEDSHRRSRSSSAQLSPEERERRRFLRMMNGSDLSSSRSSRSPIRPKTINRPPAQRLSPEELDDVINTLLKGGKVNITDPVVAADVINRLDVLRMEALTSREYLKSKKIGDIIDDIKKQVYQADREIIFKENLDILKEKHGKALDAYEDTKQTWKRKHQDFVDGCKTEAADKQYKFENAQADLDAKWLDPSMQRKFTKRSPLLLNKKAVEKYKAITGDLEGAEEEKKINNQLEKAEAQKKYQNMQERYEYSKQQLLNNQNNELIQMKIDQERKYNQMLSNEQRALGIAQKRIDMAKRNLDEQSDVDKFVLKKFKKPSNQVLPISVLNISDNAPLLSRGKGITRSGERKQTELEPEPLQLPPLKIKPAKPQKIVINLK